MRRFVLGDPHGAYRAMLQVFEKSCIAYKKDQLICLGDVADSWSEVPECFDELLKFKNLVYILGNHDAWLLDYFNTGERPHIWTSQGGLATIAAYDKRIKERGNKSIVPHKKLLSNAKYYHITEDNKCFVHGGFNWKRPIATQDDYDLTWDRNLFAAATYWEERQKEQNLKIKEFDEVFIGHTTTSWFRPDLTPVHASNLWNLDQGAGWEGKLTLMDIDSKEFWQSDMVTTFYPGEHGRR